MPREIFINATLPDEKRVAVLDGRKLVEFYTERPESVNLVGNIYKGRVESVIPGMAAAFVDIGVGKNGFLYVADVVKGLSDYERFVDEEAEEDYTQPVRERGKSTPPITEILKKGEEILVQVVKEPISTKGPRLTSHISIPGRFLVMMPFENRIGVSKRIDERAERERIKKILEELKLPKDMGFIVRTAAIGATKKDFFQEARYLTRLWQHIKAKAGRAKPPQLIHQEYDLARRIARDLFTTDVVRFEIDSRFEFKRILHFLNIIAPHLKPRLKLYNAPQPMFEKFDIEKQIDKIYDRFARLKSGGYLVFDETESLVAIDVNTGRFVGKRNLEDTAYKTNLEAAEEIPRQLKLRDIGGIIIIDFIDMEVPSHRTHVFRTLERALDNDKARTKILNISSIGIVEMTRQRQRKSIEGKNYQKCPYCNGRGLVKSPSTIAIELVRELERTVVGTRSKAVWVTLHPEVVSYVSAPERGLIKALEHRFRKIIRLTANPNQRFDEIKIEQGSA